MDDSTLTLSDFHNVAHKQIVNAAYETLADAKLEWALLAPLLEAAREVCRGDFRHGGARVRLHTVRAAGEDWVQAEEAFLGLTVADRESGEQWLSESWWLSDIAVADGDPEAARAAIEGMRRSIARIEAWLADREAGPPQD